MDPLEQATEALSNDVAQSATSSQQAPMEQPQTPSKSEAQAIIDLERAEKIKFDGREWTPEDMRKAMMRNSDYTKKTQALSQETRFWKNLDADLATVQKNPSLAQEFYKTYPKEFHKFLKYAGVDSGRAENTDNGQRPTGDVDPALMDRLNQMEGYIREKEVEKHQAVLDAKFSRLSQKYPEAIEDVVLAQAQVILDKNADNRGFELNDEMWDRLWKQSHESMVKRFQSRQKETLQTQRAANLKGKGPGPGGGTPGTSPTRVKFKDVADMAVKDLTTRRS